MKIGDTVPYINTRGNIVEVKIQSFEIINNGDVWFRGLDSNTNAKVHYPVHISVKLMKTDIRIINGLSVLTNPSYETGREGCAYNDTEYNSVDVCFGYNIAKEEVKDYVIKLINKV